MVLRVKILVCRPIIRRGQKRSPLAPKNQTKVRLSIAFRVCRNLQSYERKILSSSIRKAHQRARNGDKKERAILRSVTGENPPMAHRRKLSFSLFDTLLQIFGLALSYFAHFRPSQSIIFFRK